LDVLYVDKKSGYVYNIAMRPILDLSCIRPGNFIDKIFLLHLKLDSDTMNAIKHNL